MAEDQTRNQNQQDQIEPIQPIPQIAPPVSEPYTEIHEASDRNWLRILALALAAVLVAIILVFGIRWIYHSVTNNSSPTQNTSQSQKKAATNPTPAGGPSRSASPSPSTPPSASPSPSTGKTSPSPSPGQLPNNGPGDIVAIFAGVALASGGLHYIWSLRQTAKA